MPPIRNRRSAEKLQPGRSHGTVRKSPKGLTELTLQTWAQTIKNWSAQGRPSLCDRCSKLDLNKYFDLNSKTLGTHNTQLGSIDTWRISSCTMCMVFFKCLIGTGRNIQAISGQFEMSETGFITFPDRMLLQSIPRVNFIAIKNKPSPSRSFIGRSYVLPLPTIDSKLWRSQLIQLVTPKINFRTIQKWMTICSERHGHDLTQENYSEGLRLRMVNCRTRRIVSYPPKEKYIALSYVWGSSGSSKSEIERLPS